PPSLKLDGPNHCFAFVNFTGFVWMPIRTTIPKTPFAYVGGEGEVVCIADVPHPDEGFAVPVACSGQAERTLLCRPVEGCSKSKVCAPLVKKHDQVGCGCHGPFAAFVERDRELEGSEAEGYGYGKGEG